MDDLISRQAAIEAIMGEPTDAHYPSWYAERLEQLPSAQPEQRWIPCSERLPEEGVNVLLCIKDWESQKNKNCRFFKTRLQLLGWSWKRHQR